MKIRKLVLCDIDGCLNGGKHVSFDLDAIQHIKGQIVQLNALDIHVAICTGRPQPYAEAVAQMLGLTLPMICESGATFYDPATDLVTAKISAADRTALMALRDLLEQRLLADDGLFLEAGNENSVTIVGPKLSQSNTEEIGARIKALQAEFSAVAFNWTNSAVAIDITPMGINKGSGGALLLEHCGLDWAGAIAIGDSAGDTPMLELSALALCPRNATPAATAAADIIAKQDHAQGTIELFDAIIAGG